MPNTPRNPSRDQLQIITSEVSGIEHSIQLPPIGYIAVAVYSPHSTPWDYYGMKQCHEWEAIMKASYLNNEAPIPCITLEKKARRISPHGSGPGGRVRFGDDMMPSLYSLVVPAEFVTLAKLKIECHKLDVEEWLDGASPMPAVTRACM